MRNKINSQSGCDETACSGSRFCHPVREVTGKHLEEEELLI
jgi:hypothetical protein